MIVPNCNSIQCKCSHKCRCELQECNSKLEECSCKYPGMRGAGNTDCLHPDNCITPGK